MTLEESGKPTLAENCVLLTNATTGPCSRTAVESRSLAAVGM